MKPSFRLYFLVCVAHYVGCAQGNWLKPPTYCVFGCYTAIEFVTFTSVSEKVPYFVGLCHSDDYINSVYYCVATYCSENDNDAGLAIFRGICSSYGGREIPEFSSALAETRPEILANVTRVVYPSGLSQAFSEPVVPDRAFFDLAYASNASFYKNINFSMYFSWAFYGYWGLVLLIGSINRAIQIFCRRSQLSSSWLRRVFILPTTFGTHCQQSMAGMGTLPPRIESLLIVLYFLLNFVACFPGYHLFTGDIFGSEKDGQLIRYLSDRLGILAIANLPIVWVFSARNDPFLWLTGWSYATYNHFHRWVGRLAALLTILHSIVYTATYRSSSTYGEEVKETYFISGIIGTVAVSLMLGVSIYYLRTTKYDLFLVFHIALAIIVLVCTYYHVKLAENDYLKAWIPFIWPCVAMWSLDRLLRVARILFHVLKGVHVPATYEPDSQIIRLDVSDVLSYQRSSPGHFYYIYYPDLLQGYQSHPFTLRSWSRKPQKIESATSLPEKSTSTEATLETENKFGEELSQTFLLRPYAGFTRRLRDKITSQAASKVENNSCSLKILLEGPYGVSRVLNPFSTVLFIAGGSGITPAVNYANAVLKDPVKNQSIRIAWALRQRNLADSVCANELHAFLGNKNFKIDVYLTDPTSNEEKGANPPYAVQIGRPDIEDIIREERKTCSGSIAVLCCSPPQMVDECRHATVRILAEPGPEMHFFNELLTW